MTELDQELEFVPTARGGEPSTSARSILGVRGVAGIIFLCCAAVLAVAVWLTPNARGYGTHQQLGFQPCGMLVYSGLPCPSCGMTTAFSNTVRGRFWAAIAAQSGGFLLALGTIFAAIVSFATLVRGQIPRVFRRWCNPYFIFWFILLATMGGWAIRLFWGFADGTLPVEFVRAK
ncbi:MAG: DUF2752 domain-containing protein [Phycisphaerae bacterium]